MNPGKKNNPNLYPLFWKPNISTIGIHEWHIAQQIKKITDDLSGQVNICQSSFF